MADFAIWAVAAERGRDEPEAFMAAFARVRAAGHEQAIEASAIGGALLTFVGADLTGGPWQGTAKDLLARLVGFGGEAATRQKEWPKSPRGLSGMLRALAPALRAIGVAVILDRKQGKNRTRLIRLELTDAHAPQDGGERPSASSAPSAEDAAQDDQPDQGADDTPPEADGWAEPADGWADDWSGDADGTDGLDTLVSVGVSETQSDLWGEV
jgi:hypothetical protein